ncbi:MAG: c-type cytochrome domain-containing protein, partial [Gemmataceae bacterium]
MRRSTLSFAPLVALAAGVLTVDRTPAPVAAEPSSPPVEKAKTGKLQYNRDVRPILAENCFACHGPDSAARKAGLRLDQR